MNNSVTITLLSALLAATLIAGCGGAVSTTTGGGTPAPSADASSGGGTITDFALKDIDGRTVVLSDYLGTRVILISFWATWCEPCKKEMVQLQELYDAHREAGLQVLSISMDEPETQGDVRPYIKQRGYTFPVLLDTETQVTNQLNPKRSAPFTMIIDRDQEIVFEHETYVPGDEKALEAAVLQALGL